MKISLLLLSVLLFTDGFLLAQPLLVASNATPTGTEAFAIHTCGVSSYTYGAGGAGSTWNFAGVSTITTDTIIYSSCTGSALCDSFSGSGESSLRNGGYRFYSSDTDVFAMLGTQFSSEYIHYSTPWTMLFYPASYGDTATRDYVFSQPAASSYGHGTISFTADGYGTLILPSGTFSNVLRVHAIQINIDSNTSGGSPAVDTFRTDNYSWYMPGFHSPLLSMFYDFGTLTGIPLLAQLLYYTPVTISTGIAPAAAVDSDAITIYPDPASGRLNISQYAVTGSLLTVDIYDVLDHKVITTRNAELKPGNNEIGIDLPPLSTGVYFAHIISQGKLVVKKVLIRQ